MRHVWMCVCRAVVLAWAAGTALTCIALAQALRQPTLTAPELTITAPAELRAAATRIEQLDSNRLTGVMRLLGLSQPGPAITVILAPETSEVSRRTPPWIAGFANSEAGVIVLFPSRTPSYPYASLEELLHHEVAHVLIARAAPGADVPRWFHEGLAMAAERTWGLEDHTRLALALVAGRGSIAQLNADFDGSAQQVARAYGVSGAFVRDLLRRHGTELPGRILSRLAAGERFDGAFANSAGIPLDEAEHDFWRHSWWYQVIPFVTSSLALWMGITLLSLYAMRRRARHRARLRQRWETEEREAALDGVHAESPDIADRETPRA